MLAVDRIMSLLAPHCCIGCGVEGSVMCMMCIDLYCGPVQPRCAGCRQLTDNFETCNSCRKWLNLNHIFVATNYAGANELLLKNYKFDLKRQAVEPISYLMGLAYSGPSDFVLCPLPTATSRIRQRGFDHAKLISNALSKSLDLKYKKLLTRHTNVRQLGSSRTERLRHMEKEFQLSNGVNVKGMKILLVDDVMTTGASLAAAAKELRKAGAKEVSAIIFSQKNR